MNQDIGGQGDPLADGVSGDDPSIAHGELPEPEGPPAGTVETPSGTQTVAEPAPPGVDTGGDQPGTPGVEPPDPAGIEPGETQSVPTTRGPGPDDDGDDAPG